MILQLALMIAAFILFAIAAAGVESGRFSLVAAGLACLTLAQILQLNVL